MRWRRRRGADAHLTWLDVGDDVLAFDQGAGFRRLANLSSQPVPLARHGRLLLASGTVPGDELPPDTAAWLSGPRVVAPA